MPFTVQSTPSSSYKPFTGSDGPPFGAKLTETVWRIVSITSPRTVQKV
eukprot:COSAG04_NODE_1298_length_7325_cov_2.902989_8_plen_47_part_01